MMRDDMPSHTLDPTLTRRTFLTAGGATIVYLAGCRSGLASSKGGLRADGRVWTGPWLAITKDNDVVVFVDKCEMGQGVRHMFASIVAEELGLKPEDVVVEEADIDPARYGNRHVVPEIHGFQLGRF